MADEGGGALIELDEEIEGELIGTRNYRFSKVGEPVPLLNNSEFDPQCLPSQPLAVSERFRLLFVAHPQGFCVARTKDVLASAKEIEETGKGSSVADMSLLDVQIGKVSMLAVSDDDSFLAVIVGSDVHFFAIMALLHKEKRPSYSVSIDDSGSIKDMRWAIKDPKAYVILSADGKLYHGSGQGPLSCVMESVISVDWSMKGNFVVVAKKNTISIFSLQFKEKLSFLIPFESVGGDSDFKQVIKVDSVRWIRPDCIAVGCFQLDEDGMEENYIVQVITSRGQRITDVSAATKPVLLSFSSVFLELCFDAVPARNGPHLFLKYLDMLGIAILANRNLSKNVGLFCWSQDNEKNDVAVVEILNDAWNLHLNEYQDNEEENVLLGLCVDKVSENENDKLVLGDEEKEVSPCCVVICLTIDGKISVFHFASAVGPPVPPEGAVLDEGDAAAPALMKPEPSQISSGGGAESREALLKPESHTLSTTEIEKLDAKATFRNDLSPSFHVNARPEDQTSHGNTGQKPVQISQKLEVDEPKKSFFIMHAQDSNAEKQSISNIETSPGFFSGKGVGDFSSQSMGSFSLSSHNMEPLGKMPSKDSPSAWSSTWSNDASRTSAGRFFPLPSEPVDSSEKAKSSLKFTGGVLQDPADLKDKAKSSLALTSVGPMPSIAQGNKHSMPSYPSPDVPSDDNVPSGNFFKSGLKKDLAPVSSPRRVLYSAPNAPKQFGNVEEMAKSLDTLLEGIEGENGFVDACITSQENSVQMLEAGIWDLSDRCRMQRGLLEDHLKQVQLLHDKAVQVLVRKIYMEGIFKQATDSRYWELWNRQKLSSELELKRKCILEINQELTNQLIELERHFNSIEFNKFGENGGTERNRRALQSGGGRSRNIQSLHSLHNTMTAQLAAAEHLSGCLSEQMAVLRIESSVKHDAKKKLFESIGLPYVGDSHRSLGSDTTYGTSPNKELLITSRTGATKEQSRRNCVSNAKSYEPETARRRRDSLDRSWTTFEPPKTTINRVLLKEDYEKGSASPSLLNGDRQYLTPHSQKGSEVAHSASFSTSGVSLNRYKSKGTAEVAGKQSIESPPSPLLQRTAGSLDNAMQVSSKLSFSASASASPSPSIFDTQTSQSSDSGALTIIDGKLRKNSLPFTGKSDSFAGNELKNVQQSDNNLRLISSTSNSMPEQLLPPSSYSTEKNLGRFELRFTNSAMAKQTNTQILTENASYDSKIPVTSVSAFSSTLNSSDKGSFTKSPAKPSQSHDGVSASTSLRSVFSASSVSSITLPALAPSVSNPNSPTVFHASSEDGAAKEDVSQPRALFPSALDFTSAFSLSTAQNSVSSISSSSTVSKSEALISLSQPPVTINDSKTEGISQTQASVASMPSTAEKDVPVSQPQFGISTSISDDTGDLSKPSSETSVSKSERSYTTEALLPIAISSGVNAVSEKDVISDASHEEDMDEAAPEIDQSSGFSLGALGGFGIGSTPNPTTAPRNPFGVAGLNNDMISPTSPFSMSPSPTGELFRPASFTFQSPQSPEPPKPANAVSFSGGFGSNNPGQVSAASGFGQAAHIGVGQQALGSVLGAFGQSRQVGAGLPGSDVPSSSGFGGGFTGGGFGGGFASAATGGRFAKLATAGGGFAAAASGGGFAAASSGVGFGGTANAGGGFGGAANSGGGFGAAATPGAAVSGGGFGAFGNQQGGAGGFSAFGGGSGAARPPSDLFTQMRR